MFTQSPSEEKAERRLEEGGDFLTCVRLWSVSELKMRLLQNARAVWRTLVVILTPTLLLPLIVRSSQESRCGYVVLVMAVYWVTEALPLAVTALLPVVLFPLLGVMKSRDVGTMYFKDVLFFLMGTLVVAAATEETKLHRRFALRFLLLVGVKPRRLLLGVMLVTWFLSMWMTNVATTAMMTPIARVLLARLFDAKRQQRQALKGGFSIDNHTESQAVPQEQTNKGEHENDENIEFKPLDVNHVTRVKHDDGPDDSDDDGDEGGKTLLDTETLDEESLAMLKALTLSVCYSANIGGVATLTGTGPNIVFKNFLETLSNGQSQITFLSWMVFGLPVALLVLALGYLIMLVSFFGCRNTVRCRRQTSAAEDKAMEDFLRQEHRKLGNMSFAEKVALGHFVLLVLLWLTRAPGQLPGWGNLFPTGFVSDSVASVLVMLSLFVWPNARPRGLFYCRGEGGSLPYVSQPSVVRWKSVCRKIPWGIFLLLGGGFALVEGIKVSGLSSLIAGHMMVFTQLPPWLAMISVIVSTSLFTEIVSNTVLTTLLLPILAQLAIAMDVHPIYLMLPATVASSFAFMLPVATPPNAIVFAYGDVKVVDMLKVGMRLNFVGMSMLGLVTNTIATAYFDLSTVPDWARQLGPNTTTVTAAFNQSMANSTVG